MSEWLESEQPHPTPKRIAGETHAFGKRLAAEPADPVTSGHQNKGVDMAEDSTAWAENFRTATESDPVIQSYAKYYTCDFLFDMEELRVGVYTRAGQVHDIAIDSPPLTPHHFSLHASAETWRKMS